MNFVEEKTRAETVFQRELTDQEFAEVLMERIDHLQNEIKGRDTHIESLENRLNEATEKDVWDDIRNHVEEVLGMDGRSSVTLRFENDGTVRMDFSVYGLTVVEGDSEEEDDLF